MYKRNAFGNPDGSRVEITDMMKEFVIFDKKYESLGVALPDEMKTRVIVGAKGSGKTVYLRRMRANLKLNQSICVSEIEQELPSTSLIVKFGQLYSEQEITEKWMQLWKCAILRSVISNALLNRDWNYEVTEKQKEILKEYEEILFPKYRTVMGVYAEARSILNSFRTAKEFNEYFEKSEWDEIERIISNMLVQLPPFYFFIDSVDEEYAHAPMYWLRCQKGLFYRVMRSFRHDKYGNKLHIVISIRDHVLASVYKSEHKTRYINEEHICLLNWNYESIKYFFETKIANLNNCYFINENNSKTLTNWLGINEIHNIRRGIIENLEDYILRHTRLLPRDIVIIGNSLAEIKMMVYEDPSKDVEKLIRRKVARVAKIFGDELLQICANQIVNNEMPKGAARQEYSEIYTSVVEYSETYAENIKKILFHIGSDKFDVEKIKECENLAIKLLGEHNNLFNILWQNGAVGYYEDSANGWEEVFFAEEDFEDFLLPRDKKTYILRSCLVDAVGIQRDEWDSLPIIGGNI